MTPEHAKRLKKLVPVDGGFDLSFNLASSGQQGKVASTMNLTIFGASVDGKGPAISKRISIPSIQDTIELANSSALENALTLLGV